MGRELHRRIEVMYTSQMGTLIGDPDWVHGPLVVASSAVAKRFAKDFKTVKAGLVKYINRGVDELLGPETMKMFGEEVLLLPDGTPTEWLPLGGGGVLHRPHGKKKLNAENAVVPERLAKPITLPKNAVLFDAVAQAPEGSEQERLRAKHTIPLGLVAGRYTIEYSTPAPSHEIPYDAVRLWPADEAPATTVAAKKDPTFAVTAEMKKQAKGLKFVESEGGPLVVLPASVVSKWSGAVDNDGRDYEQACSVRKGVFEYAGHDALVLESPTPTAFMPTSGGGVFLRWLGADDAVDLVAALPHAKKWKRINKLKVTGPMVVFASESPGKKLKKSEQLAVALANGTYTIDRTEVEGETAAGHEVMAELVRLTRA